MDVTAALAKEIVKRFRKRADNASIASLTQELAAFVVRLSLFASAQRDEKGNVAKTPEAIETMAEEISKYLANCSPHVMATLSLQCQTAGLRSSLANKRRNEQVKQEAVRLRLLGSLCENSARQPEEILSEIVFYILHCYMQLQGTAGDASARKETVAALNGVLPRTQVRAFVNQPEEEKTRQLEELRRIVWGIRLYNKAEGRTAGSGLLALRETAETTLTDMDSCIARELKTVTAICDKYVAVLRSRSLPLSTLEQQTLREEYHRQMQLRLNLRTAWRRLEDLASRIRNDLLPAFDAALAELQAVLGAGAMRSDGITLHNRVPKRAVYPKFIALADAYENARQSFEEFEELQTLLDVSLSLGKVPVPSLPPTLLEEATATAKRDGAADCQAILGHMASVGATHGLSYVKNYAELRQTSALCAMSGLCPVSLMEDGICVEGRMSEKDKAFPGFVLRATPAGGRGEWYAFGSEYALRQFVTSPLRFTGDIARMAQDDIVLIGLLGWCDRIPRELYISGTRQYEMRDAMAPEKVGHEVATQTGQMDPYMDHNYRWNEWDLRRQALKLVNLLNMRTHSTQTIASHFRRSNTTQVRPPRDDETQTMQDAAVQPPRMVQYLKGLRGTKTSAIETVQKTFLY